MYPYGFFPMLYHREGKLCVAILLPPCHVSILPSPHRLGTREGKGYVAKFFSTNVIPPIS